MTTREFLTSGEFTGGPFNRLIRHPLARNDGSTLFVMDFGRTDCNPHSGSLTDGATFDNLEGTPDGVVSGTSNAISSSGGKLTVPTWVSGSNQVMNIGSAGSFNLTTANPDFHAHFVFSLPNDAGSASLGFAQLWSVGTANDNLFRFDAGTNGRAPRCNATTQSGGPVYTTITGFTLGAVNIVSLTRVGNSLQLWLNGVQVGSRTVNATLPDLSGVTMQMFGGRAGETVWAAMLETIPEGRTAAQAVARAYAASNAAGYS